MKFLKVLAGVACLCFPPGTVTAETISDAEQWARIAKGGYVLLLQHTDALQDTGTPSDLRNSNCSTLDELSEQGQRQADRLRVAIERHNIPIARVLTSHDCRCVQTAGLAFGRAEPWSILDEEPARRAADSQEKSAALREAIDRWSSDGNLVLISHASVFREALGASPGLAELIVIEPLGDDNDRVLGRLSYK